MAADPNWLYATIAQASATIVAIIGGLITATLLQLSSKRGSLISRIDERRGELDAFRRERDMAQNKADRLRAYHLIRDNLQGVLRTEAVPDADEAGRQFGASHIPFEVFAKE